MVQIAERRDGRNHIIEHVGTARSEAELEVLMAQARRRLRPGQEMLDVEVAAASDQEGLPQRPAVITGKRSALLWRVLSAAYDRLGFDVVADDAFKELVLARIIEPTSKADSQRVLDEVGVEHASLRTMFRSLARAQERDYRGQAAAACFTHAAASGDISLCLYDVTTLYFEAEHEDELAKSGSARNGGWTRRSWSVSSWTATASPWRSAATRATPPKQPRSSRSSSSSTTGTG